MRQSHKVSIFIKINSVVACGEGQKKQTQDWEQNGVVFIKMSDITPTTLYLFKHTGFTLLLCVILQNLCGKVLCSKAFFLIADHSRSDLKNGFYTCIPALSKKKSNNIQLFLYQQQRTVSVVSVQMNFLTYVLSLGYDLHSFKLPVQIVSQL